MRGIYLVKIEVVLSIPADTSVKAEEKAKENVRAIEGLWKSRVQSVNLYQGVE